MVVSGMTSINLPALEKRFQLSSKDLGLIAASNDISAILLVSFVSFYGEFGNKIKWLGYGMLITGQFQWCMRYLRTSNVPQKRLDDDFGRLHVTQMHAPSLFFVFPYLYYHFFFFGKFDRLTRLARQMTKLSLQ